MVMLKGRRRLLLPKGSYEGLFTMVSLVPCPPIKLVGLRLDFCSGSWSRAVSDVCGRGGQRRSAIFFCEECLVGPAVVCGHCVMRLGNADTRRPWRGTLLCVEAPLEPIVLEGTYHVLSRDPP